MNEYSALIVCMLVGVLLTAFGFLTLFIGRYRSVSVRQFFSAVGWEYLGDSEKFPKMTRVLANILYYGGVGVILLGLIFYIAQRIIKY